MCCLSYLSLFVNKYFSFQFPLHIFSHYTFLHTTIFSLPLFLMLLHWGMSLVFFFLVEGSKLFFCLISQRTIYFGSKESNTESTCYRKHKFRFSANFLTLISVTSMYVPSLRIFLNENQSLDFSDWKHNQEEDLATIHIILSLISYSITTTEFLPPANISTLTISKWI